MFYLMFAVIVVLVTVGLGAIVVYALTVSGEIYTDDDQEAR